MAYEFQGRSIEAGETEWIEVNVTHDVDMTPLSFSTCVLNGTSDGPVYWIQGCLHGPEQIGAYAIRSFLDDINPTDVSGTIIATPVVNGTAFNNKQRESPLDKKDLNRQFPGSKKGSFSDLLANQIFSLGCEHADAVVDMHTGGNEFMIPGYSIYPTTNNEIESTTKRLCEATDLPYAIGISAKELGDAMYSQLAKNGIPAIITETGGEGRLHEEHISNAVTALWNVARSLDVLEGPPNQSNETSFHEGLDILQSKTGGFFELEVPMNQPIDEGVTMAKITNLQGEIVESIEAPYDAIVVAARTYAVTRPGDWVFEITPQ
jgi:predicted deacylase